MAIDRKKRRIRIPEGQRQKTPTLAGNFYYDVTEMTARPYQNPANGYGEVVSLSLETAGGFNGYVYMPAEIAEAVARQMLAVAGNILAKRAMAPKK